MKRLNKDLTKSLGIPARKLSKYQFLTKDDIDDALFQEYLKQKTPENYDPAYKYYEEPLNRLIELTLKEREKAAKEPKNWFTRITKKVNKTAKKTGEKIGNAISSGVSSLLDVATSLFSNVKGYLPMGSEMEPQIMQIMDMDRQNQIANPGKVAENIVSIIGTNLVERPTSSTKDNERKLEGIQNFVELLNGVADDPTKIYSPAQKKFANNARTAFREYFIRTQRAQENPFANVGTFEIKAEQPDAEEEALVVSPKRKTNSPPPSKSKTKKKASPSSDAIDEAPAPSAVIKDAAAPPPFSEDEIQRIIKEDPPVTVYYTLLKKMKEEILDDSGRFISRDLRALDYTDSSPQFSYKSLPKKSKMLYESKWNDALVSSATIIKKYPKYTSYVIDLLKALPWPSDRKGVTYSKVVIDRAMNDAEQMIYGFKDLELVPWLLNTFIPLKELLQIN